MTCRVTLQRAMPKPRKPHVASPDEVRFTRDGDYLIVEHADPRVATTRLMVGSEKLATMKDDELVDYWNALQQLEGEYRQTVSYVAREIPLGKPQVTYHEDTQRWSPRGHVLRCVWTEYLERDPEAPCVTVDDRDYTLGEFARMLNRFAGWGMRIEFVPDDGVHERPEIAVEDGEG